MAMWVVQSWSVRETERAACDRALQGIAAHIEAEHPEILEVRTFVQWTGTQPHRGYVWMEKYESLTALEEAPATPRCAEVWAPVHAVTMPGTHGRNVWIDVEPNLTR